MVLLICVDGILICLFCRIAIGLRRLKMGNVAQKGWVEI